MFTIDAHQVAGHTGLAASRRARVATRSLVTGDTFGFGTTDFAMYPCGWQGKANNPIATPISHKAWRPKEFSP